MDKFPVISHEDTRVTVVLQTPEQSFSGKYEVYTLQSKEYLEKILNNGGYLDTITIREMREMTVENIGKSNIIQELIQKKIEEIIKNHGKNDQKAA